MAKDALTTYRQKRDFSATSEPAGGRARAGRAGQLGGSFVVQRHAARALHYDFRLEVDGVLKSWAVPKGPSLDPQNKRLAMQVEDHPLDYGNFEGTIPAGNYGAGQVWIWDAGTWSSEHDARTALKQGRFHFRLEGGYLRGEWILIRTRQQDKRQQWLLRKLDDGYSQPGHDAQDHEPLGRGAGKAPAQAARPAHAAPASKKAAAALAAKPAAGQAAQAGPKSLGFQLATLVDAPPPGADWVYELKYDGYRMMCRIDKDGARFFSRTGREWTDKLGQLPVRIAAMKLGYGWLDGEVLVFDENGRSDFQLLQASMDGKAPAPSFVAFDLPYWNGHDLRQLPWTERRAALQAIAPTRQADRRYLQISELLAPEDAQASADIWRQACELQLEGLIGKRRDAPYRVGRQRSWIKLKCRPRQEMVIGGYTLPRGARQGFGALLLGVYDDKGKLRYAGKVGTGFNDTTIGLLKQQMDALRQDKSPFAGTVRPLGTRPADIRWLSPTLVAEIQFANWTGDHMLRQASFLGLRQDKKAREVRRELPAKPAAGGGQAGPRQADAEKSNAVAGVSITHPERRIYVRPALTKLDLARYYESAGELILPHLLQRRLALLRCPDGTQGACFFQKHLSEEPPAGLALDGGMIVVQNLEGLIALVQRGVIEFHTWGSRSPRSDTPDRITFDLDPGPGLGWRRLADAAQITRALLQELGMDPLLKTTGGKGLHLVVPIKGRHGWDTVKAFAHAVARHLAETLPGHFIAKASKSSRKGVVFVDYLRNGEGATAVAAFSARAREGAPVSMPVPWEVLDEKRDLRGKAFNVRNAVQPTARDDPWKDYEAARVTLTQAMLRKMSVK
ncbi:DNA ligase D [Orrella sp. JC864]|uniref:DNA ligase D n=1 Tax=Orrella sp. JC864 TaxID=3120298 RepID=UPI00300B03C6